MDWLAKKVAERLEGQIEVISKRKREELEKLLGKATKEAEKMEKISRNVLDALSTYSKEKCDNCSKAIIAYRGGYWRDSKGHTFCSKTCVTNWDYDKEKPKKPAPKRK